MVVKRVIFICCIVIVAFFIYWLLIRPAQAKTACDMVAMKAANKDFGYDPYWKKERIEFSKEDYNFIYSQCLHNKGI